MNSPEPIVKIENDFKSFKKQVGNSSKEQKVLKFEVGKHKNQVSLSTQAWEFFKGSFPFLFVFCGGLPTIFPGTDTVESDFTVLQWEKNPFRSGLSNLTVEGILQ